MLLSYYCNYPYPKAWQYGQESTAQRESAWPTQFWQWPNSGRRLTVNDQILEDDLPRLAKSRLTTSWNLKRGFDETISLKPSSRDERFKLVIGRNRNFKLTFLSLKNACKSLWLVKPSKKSLSRTKWCYVPSEIVSLKYKKNLSGLQFITVDWMSLVLPPSSNGRKIPLRHKRVSGKRHVHRFLTNAPCMWGNTAVVAFLKVDAWLYLCMTMSEFLRGRAL